MKYITFGGEESKSQDESEKATDKIKSFINENGEL